jgi:hypothetical protein
MPLHAHPRLARQALERRLAVLQAGGPPEPERVVGVIAEPDEALRELDALERPVPFRVRPGGIGPRDQDGPRRHFSFKSATPPISRSRYTVVFQQWTVLPSKGKQDGR